MLTDEQKIWDEIVQLRLELNALKAKKQVLKEHSQELKDISDYLAAGVTRVKEIADRVGEVLQDDE